MPRLNGFEVPQALSPCPIPVVIFTTAHDDHAIRAFEFNALDYLLKPFSEARFKKSLHKARVRLAGGSRSSDPGLKGPQGQPIPQSQELGEYLSDPLSGFSSSSPRKSPGSKRRAITSSCTRTKSNILRETISAMESRLATAGFMRISRSVIVNLACIREIQTASAGRYSLQLKNGTRLDMTCSLGELQSRIGQV